VCSPGRSKSVRFDEEEDADISGDEVARLLDATLRAIDNADALVFEDYNKGVLTPTLIMPAMQQADRRNIPVVVDPKYKNFFAYNGGRSSSPIAASSSQRSAPPWTFSTRRRCRSRSSVWESIICC